MPARRAGPVCAECTATVRSVKSDTILVLSFPGRFMSFDILVQIREQVILLLRKQKNDKFPSRYHLNLWTDNAECVLVLIESINKQRLSIRLADRTGVALLVRMFAACLVFMSCKC